MLSVLHCKVLCGDTTYEVLKWFDVPNLYMIACTITRGRSRGRGVLGIRTSPPPPFGRPLNFIKGGKTLPTCAQMHRILVVNSYPDSPPPFFFFFFFFYEILYMPLITYISQYVPEMKKKSITLNISKHLFRQLTVYLFKSIRISADSFAMHLPSYWSSFY